MEERSAKEVLESIDNETKEIKHLLTELYVELKANNDEFLHVMTEVLKLLDEHLI